MTETVNDAEKYGVTIAPCTPAAGEWYWKCVRVHHLTGAENRGNHHLYLDVLDTAGVRINGARIAWSWVGDTTPGMRTVTIDKPATEPGANIPIDSIRQVLWAYVLDGLKSDRVYGVTTKHPDEEDGNTLGHHSFLAVWQKTRAEIDPEPQPSATWQITTQTATRIVLELKA